jgi:hypothetical protein
MLARAKATNSGMPVISRLILWGSCRRGSDGVTLLALLALLGVGRGAAQSPPATAVAPAASGAGATASARAALVFDRVTVVDVARGRLWPEQRAEIFSDECRAFVDFWVARAGDPRIFGSIAVAVFSPLFRGDNGLYAG